MINRRNALTLGAVGGVGLALPTESLMDFAFGPSWTVEPFTRALPIPQVLRPSATRIDTDVYRLTVGEGTAEIVPGVRTNVLTYNGQFPGPTILARQGRTAKVVVTNTLASATAVHLHGGNVPADSDGHPMHVIEPGRSRTYTYPNIQRAGTLWYHDHAHHLEAEQVYRGLSGLYLIEDARPTHRLPSGAHDIPLLLRDADISRDGELQWAVFGQANRSLVLVNGAAQPRLAVRRRRYRLRLVNGANERTFRLKLSNGAEFVQVGSDGGLLPRPVRRSEITLWPAERADVVVEFSGAADGSQIFLENIDGESDASRRILRFDVAGGPESDGSSVPATLAPAPIPKPPTVTRKVELSFDALAGTFLINGKAYDPERVDFTVKRGTTELWEITNLDTQFEIPHSLHLHLIQFRVLDRDGIPAAEWEAYPKDTVAVPPGTTVRILATFDSPYTGIYPFHCHFIDHSSTAMMAQIKIEP
ncbi:Multicopper oxidase [Alloactinosynnema sp. L-07]|uniref:multicopper oxidase family protein n=1 Tax=Alloactinosynnema sp. L-07 TaxID=1653480 RepID=UPI00065EF5D2|nr:multicopper oxidase domain-containing protein [Alloactinosynnema sp. L-07]CRK62116.1 Multicopper oxidase [Alloactinosynnema sp. L-07]